jgi:hypothetical protein
LNIQKYFLFWRINGGDFIANETIQNSFTFTVANIGLYEFKVVAININNQESDDSAIGQVFVTDAQTIEDYSISRSLDLI